MLKIKELKINHQNGKIYVDECPYFSWKIESNNTNVFQEKYHLTISDKTNIVYDSNIVKSNESTFIKPEFDLKKETVYRVFLEVVDNHKELASITASFETGLLSGNNFKGKWIESTFLRSENKAFTYGIINRPVYFNRDIEINKEVLNAKLYITCYGAYDCYINGYKISDGYFHPEFTPYEKKLNYQIYDIRDNLSNSINELSILVGDGWYFNGQMKVVTDKKKIDNYSILYQIKIDYLDGESEYIYSDGSEIIKESNILFSDLFMGEKVDRTLNDNITKNPIIKDYGYDNIKLQGMPYVKVIEEFEPSSIYKAPNGDTIVDFGQVITGFTRVNIHEEKGKEIVLDHTEIVDENKNYFQVTIAKQKDTIISNGEPFTFEPHFTFHGFRYVRVSGVTDVKPQDFKACLLSTEKENLSSFESSDSMLNRLYKNIRYSEKNNMLSVPTDCPTREKAAWSGDILIYAKTALLNEDVTPFLESWVDGLIKDQLDNGVVTLISPYTEIYQQLVRRESKKFGYDDHNGISGWSDAILFVPYYMYKVTGNKLILKKAYNAMKKWADYIIYEAENRRGSDLPYEIDRYLFNTGFHFGEWLVPDKPNIGFDSCKETATYIAPYFGFKAISLMAEINEILDIKDDYYLNVSLKMKNAIVEGLFRNDRLTKEYQGAYVLAFAFDLVPLDLYNEYKNRLVNLIHENNDRLQTGFLATPYLLDTLIKLDLKDLAYKIFFSKDYPSWLYEVKMGATTIWEQWNAINEDHTVNKTSYDHYAFGVIDDFIMKYISGIDTDTISYKHLIIKPELPSNLDYVKRTFESEYGLIKVYFDKNNLELIIPCNTTATIYFNNEIINLGSGKYNFTK